MTSSNCLTQKSKPLLSQRIAVHLAIPIDNSYIIDQIVVARDVHLQIRQCMDAPLPPVTMPSDYP